MSDMPDMPDMSDLLNQAMQMQQQIVAAQEAAASQTVVGVSGGGVVRVEATGTMTFTAVHIDPSAVDPGDIEMLEDLVLAAIHDAAAKVAQLTSDAMGSIGLGALGGGLGSGLGGLLG